MDQQRVIVEMIERGAQSRADAAADGGGELGAGAIRKDGAARDVVADELAFLRTEIVKLAIGGFAIEGTLAKRVARSGGVLAGWKYANVTDGALGHRGASAPKFNRLTPFGDRWSVGITPHQCRGRS